VADYNGTLACDGQLLAGVRDRMEAVAEHLTVHVVTADTFGRARAELESLPCSLTILPVDNQDTAKLKFVQRLGPEHVVAVGNGRNDRLMLEAASVGVAIVQEEGAASQTVAAADIICTDVRTALDLLLNPKRMVATLRA
jgi:soluble P-type ATPase